MSLLVPIFEGKGGPLNPNSYRGTKLLEYVFKLYEQVLDGRLREVVDIDKMQYGFIPGRGTVDAVFVLSRLSEKCRAKNKKLFFIFVDLKKTFDRVPREIIHLALRQKGVPEYLVNGVISQGLSVNVGKINGIQLLFGKKSSVSRVDRCGVCGEQVGCNSIQCTKYQRWVHRRCSDVPRQVSLLSCWDVFACRTCLGHTY